VVFARSSQRRDVECPLIEHMFTERRFPVSSLRDDNLVQAMRWDTDANFVASFIMCNHASVAKVCAIIAEARASNAKRLTALRLLVLFLFVYFLLLLLPGRFVSEPYLPLNVRTAMYCLFLLLPSVYLTKAVVMPEKQRVSSKWTDTWSLMSMGSQLVVHYCVLFHLWKLPWWMHSHQDRAFLASGSIPFRLSAPLPWIFVLVFLVNRGRRPGHKNFSQTRLPYPLAAVVAVDALLIAASFTSESMEGVNIHVPSRIVGHLVLLILVDALCSFFCDSICRFCVDNTLPNKTVRSHFGHQLSFKVVRAELLEVNQ
jgi:hypothetical protein